MAELKPCPYEETKDAIAAWNRRADNAKMDANMEAQDGKEVASE